MSDWPTFSLENYPIEIIDGDRGSEYPKSAEFKPSGYCLFLNAGNVTADGFAFEQCAFVSQERDQRLRKGRLERNDVILTTRGTVGNVAYFDNTIPFDNVRINSGMVILRADAAKVIPRFFYFATQSPIFRSQIRSLTSGSAQPQLPIRDIRKLRLPLPPLGVQGEIVEAIGSIQDKIELNRRMNETLEAMAQAIFRDWFVDFGPTRRKMDGAADPVEIMGGLVSDPDQARELAELFPTKLGDNGLPQGWGEQPFSALLEDVIGGDWGKEAPEGDEVHPVSIIRGTDFPQILSGGAEKVPSRYTTTKKVERRRLQDLDILLEVSGGSPTQPTGRSILLTSSILERFKGDVVCASFCRRLRPHNLQTAMIAWAHLTCLYGEGGTWEYQNQSTGISNFQTTHFLGAEQIVWPGPAIAEMFASYVEPFVRSMTRNENLTLAATRDLLLPKLMSGEIRLRDGERQIEEVA